MKLSRIASRSLTPTPTTTPRGRRRPPLTLVALGLGVGCFASRASWALVHEDTHTHASLTAGALTFLGEDFYTTSRRNILVQASVDEDACPNYLSHFYNPKTGADGDIHTAPCGTFLTIQTARARAIEFYDAAVEAYEAGRFNEAFEELGTVMHLLQDMTSPAHVHIDPHLQILFGDCGNDGDDFEKWGWCESKGTDHIRDYVLESGALTARLQNNLDLLFPGGPPSPSGGVHANHFIHELAVRVYDFTSYRVELIDSTFGDDVQPPSELKRMFPNLREASGPGYYIDGESSRQIGFTNGACGGCSLDEWWLMETGCAGNGGCVIGAPTEASGFAYIENTGGEAGSGGGTFLEDKLVPDVYEKPQFLTLYGTFDNAGIPPGFDDVRPEKTMLRIYGDVLYTSAVAWGAGMLLAFADRVAPRPVAEAGGPYQGDGCSPITFDASASMDPNGTVDRYDWDFDDDGVVDATSAVPTIEHTYPAAYAGRVVLLVTDDEGRTAEDTGDVDVIECATPNPGSSGGGGCFSTVGTAPFSGGDPSLVLALAVVFAWLVARSRAVRPRSAPQLAR